MSELWRLGVEVALDEMGYLVKRLCSEPPDQPHDCTTLIAPHDLLHKVVEIRADLLKDGDGA